MSLLQGLISSVAEVIAICGFVFGVACKLPPSLTILLLNGVCWVVIARHLIWDIAYKRINHHIAGYRDVEEYRDGRCTLCLKRKLVPLLEGFALMLQLSALVTIPILLTFRKDTDNGKNAKYLTVCFLIPVTLTLISVVWSGWLQKYLVKARSGTALTDENSIARLKSGEYRVSLKQQNCLYLNIKTQHQSTTSKSYMIFSKTFCKVFIGSPVASYSQCMTQG